MFRSILCSTKNFISNRKILKGTFFVLISLVLIHLFFRSDNFPEFSNSWAIISQIGFTFNKEKNLPSYRNQIFNYVVNIARLKNPSYKEMLKETLESYDFQGRDFQPPIANSESLLIPNELHIKHNKRISVNGEEILLPLITASPIGRLGNVMGEYATLFALGKLYNISVFLNHNMKKQLEHVFPNISIKLLSSSFPLEKCIILNNEIEINYLYNYSPIELAAAGLLGPHCFNMKSYPFEIKLFHSLKKDVQKEFIFSHEIMKEVEKFYSSVMKELSKKRQLNDVTYIGIHMRATDYNKHLKAFGGNLPGISYLKNAMSICKKRFINPVFIAASDNVSRMREILNDEKYVFFPESTADIDMAILSSCNHSIFTVGSYGFWSSYLAGGDVIYAEIKTKKMPYRFSTKFYKDANLNNFLPINEDLSDT